MGWGRANETQAALAKAEQYFVSVCDTEDEVSEEDVEAAYEAMQQAAAEADEALDAIRSGVPGWASVVAGLLR